MLNNKKQRKSFYYQLLFGFLVVKLIFIGVLFNIDHGISSVPIVEAVAALAEDKPKEDTKPKETSLSLDTLTETQSNFFSNPDNSFLETEVVEREKQTLERERQVIELERQQLVELKKEIDTKIARLTQIQKSVQQKIDEQKALIQQQEEIKVAENEKHFKHLLKIYSSMPSKKSAALIDNLDMEIAIKLLSKMKGENVGQILGYVPPEKAARISERLAKNVQ